jgi:hypothetical protein
MKLSDYLFNKAKKVWNELKRFHPFDLIAIVFVLFFILPEIFQLSILLGLGSIGSFILSINNGTLSKEPEKMTRYILGGTFVSYVASTIFPSLINSFKGTDWLGFIVLGVLYIFILIKGSFLKKGIDVRF